MDIVIIANFVAELDGGANSRFTYLANMLCGKHMVELISSDFSHGRKQKRICDTSRFPYKVTLLHEPGYSKNVCIKRFESHMVWGQAVKAYLENRKKPDVIYCAVPSLTAARNAARFCKKNGIRFIIDIQDLWPEAFQMVMNIPVVSNVAFWPFKKIANEIYSTANVIIAVSQNYVDRAKEVNSRAKQTAAVYIGTDLNTFDAYVEKNKPVRKDDEFWIAYCGSLSDSYDIPCVVDAVKLLNDPKVRLVVMGDGHLKKQFQDYALQAGITADFTGYIPYPEMCGRLSACDVTVNPIRGKSAASIINKHADYAACGLPVINTQESPEYRSLVSNYNMGFNCNNGDAADMAEKLKKLMNDPSLRKEMGKNARRCAEERFDRRTTYQNILNIIQR